MSSMAWVTTITFTFEAGKIYDLGNTSEWTESTMR
jgi:hypothetical protein